MSAVPAGHFRTGLKAALEEADLDSRLAKLAALASDDLGYLETIQVDRALAAIRAADPAHVQVKLALLSSSTIDHLLPAIRVAGLRHQLLIDVHPGRYGQYRQELTMGGSPVEQFRPSTILLSLDAADVLSGVPITASRAAADRSVDVAVAELRELWRIARERFGATVIQQSFLDVTPPLFGNHERVIPGAPARLVARLNGAVADAAAEDGVLLLDVAAASARDGLESWFDERHWLQGKMQIAPPAAGRYAELLAALLGAHLGRSKKCLVLDLDNTLWGGVVGDDGVEGVKLGEGSAVGEAHLALQKYAKRLADRGIVLAVCSKNEWPIVEEMFDRHPEMHLKRSDIAAFAVNWQDKSENLRALAEQLNLGLDALVFIDDNPAERARVRDSLPMVTVPELPDDPALYVRTIARAGYFEATVLTEDDSQRAAQYAANNEREALRAAVSMDEFLRGLEMRVAYGPIGSVDLVRAAQLVNKTNQFNTTTRRMSGDELEKWCGSPANMTFQFRLRDRFGDNGLVSVMLFQGDESARDVLELANWVMSCRVFGRGLEQEAMSIAVESARERGVRAFVADFLPTKKNGVINELFSGLGFVRVGDSVSAGGSRWRLDLADYVPQRTHLSRAPA